MTALGLGERAVHLPAIHGALQHIYPADLPPSMAAEFKATIDAVDRKLHFGEYRILRPDGSDGWVEVFAAAEFDSGRKFLSCSGTIGDAERSGN